MRTDQGPVDRHVNRRILHGLGADAYGQLGAIIIQLAGVPILFPVCGLCRNWRSADVNREVATLAAAWAAAVLVCLALAHLLKVDDQISRLWFVAWLCVGWGLFAIHCRVTGSILGALRAHGLDQRHVPIFGATASLTITTSKLLPYPRCCRPSARPRASCRPDRRVLLP